MNLLPLSFLFLYIHILFAQVFHVPPMVLKIMAVPFGFSVGDFLVGIELIDIIIDCLKDSGEASTHYQSTVSGWKISRVH